MGAPSEYSPQGGLTEAAYVVSECASDLPHIATISAELFAQVQRTLTTKHNTRVFMLTDEMRSYLIQGGIVEEGLRLVYSRPGIKLVHCSENAVKTLAGIVGLPFPLHVTNREAH